MVAFGAPGAVINHSLIGLPGMSGLEGLGVLWERYPSAALVMLTVYEDDERIFDALCTGACGYLMSACRWSWPVRPTEVGVPLVEAPPQAPP